MTDNTLILGVDLGQRFLKVSCCQDNQTELNNENSLFQEGVTEEDIVLTLNHVIASYGQKEKQNIKIVFSCDDSQINMVKAVEKRLLEDGYLKTNLRLISQENAFIHYVLNQEEELRKYAVLLFDFDGTDLYVYKMVHSKKKTPLNYKAEKSLLGTFSLTGDSRDWGKLFDEKFAGILRQILSKEVVSAVYLTGAGFEGGWLKKSLKILCDGRRAFMGQNLFSSGGCYYGRTLEESGATDFMIQAPETVLYESGVLDGANRDAFVTITEAGNAWYETKGSLDVIMERAGKVDVVFVNTMTREKQVESVDISGLLNRPRKVGRLHVEVQFFDSKTGVITVCDHGFGEFQPATHQVFLKEFTLL